MKDKHPLMILLGLRLAADRGNRRTEEVASKIECATSTYRLAESGALSFNPSLSLNIAQYFGYDYVPLTLLLVAMQISGDLKVTGDIKTKLDRVATASGDKLTHLIDSLGAEFWMRYDEGDLDAFKKYIEENLLDVVLLQYLTAPTFGQTIEEKQLVYNTDTENLIDELPTLYYDRLTNFLKQMEELPLRIRFSDLGKWEERNLYAFTELYAVIRDSNAVVHPYNFQLYKFDYLWEQNFTTANFIFLDKKPGEETALHNAFMTNIEKALADAGKTDRLTELPRIANKIHFKCLNKPNETVSSILTGTDYDSVDKEVMEYDGFWVFVRQEKKPVSFLATLVAHKTVKDFPIFGEGYSLNSKDTTSRVNSFNEIWNLKK
jgi:hypothetical protein